MPVVFLSAQGFAGRKNIFAELPQVTKRTHFREMSSEWFSNPKTLSVGIKKHSLLNKKKIFSSCLPLPVSMVSVVRLRRITLKISLLPLHPSGGSQPITKAGSWHSPAHAPCSASLPWSLPPPLFWRTNPRCGEREREWRKGMWRRKEWRDERYFKE